ncbi:hypothetical protein SAMN05518871_10766 [Psychrobacillus sp. OK028]|uniref:hypothetical protein n=1 Tax=Psychrobacillus sp. OK028 TaxID=1884359 RepID=UPI00087F13EB|nr:hypothetical protein [Psychrobacillus sp. OK028]SDN72563.1 hypothetical protein SAMN05518871_10766 [Psychrobacillus sp. OK028]
MKSWHIIIACTLVFSMSIGFYLGNLMVPDLPVGTVVAGIIGSVVGVGIVLGTIKFRENRKKHNVPDVDERTWINIKNFYAISLYIVLFGSMLIVCLLFALGTETIELGFLSIYLLILFFLLVIGTFVVKRQ